MTKTEHTVTISDRQNATEIIRKLRETLSRKQIAEFIGICPAYVTTALHRTKRGDEYFCPADAIRKILAYPMLEALNQPC